MSLPPFGWWPLAWLGFAGLAVLLWGDSAWGRAGTGFAIGVGQFGVAVWWVNQFQPIGYVALVILSSAFVAAGATVVSSGRFRSVALGLPAAMVLVDWARDHFPLGGFPLGGVSLGQARSPLVPVVRLGGSLALTGVTVLVGVVIAGAAVLVVSRARRPVPRPDRHDLRPLTLELAAIAVTVASVIGGVGAPGGGRVTRRIRVALVQGGGPRGTLAISTNPDIVFARHLAASAMLRPPLDLVVWPEGVLQTYTDYRTTNGAAEISALARRLHATVVAGVEQDLGATAYTNEAVAWAPDGRIVASYEKNHRVPFGEYVPDRSLVGMFFSLKLVPRDAIAGHGPGILRTPAGPLGVMISYEVFFDGRARAAVEAGGQILVVPTNTASYAGTEVPTQEVAADALRAWETGRSLVQVTPTGYTLVMGPGGQIRQRSALDRREVIEATVGLRQGTTLYVDLGDAPVLAGALVLLGVGWLAGRRGSGRGARRHPPQRSGLPSANP